MRPFLPDLVVLYHLYVLFTGYYHSIAAQSEFSAEQFKGNTEHDPLHVYYYGAPFNEFPFYYCMAIKSKIRIEVEEQGKSVTRAFGRDVGRDKM